MKTKVRTPYQRQNVNGKLWRWWPARSRRSLRWPELWASPVVLWGDGDGEQAAHGAQAFVGQGVARDEE